MEFTHHCIDLAACRQQQLAPHDIIDRRPSDLWLVAASPVMPNEPIRWTQHRTEGQVLIPLVPYLLNQSPDLALTFALRMGLMASFSVGKPIRRVHIATGTPVELLHDAPPEQGLRYYVGFALLV